MKIIITKNCFVQGEMKQAGDEVEVDEQVANELIRAGKAEDTVELDLLDGEKTLEEMDFNELVEYGAKIGAVNEDDLRDELIEKIQADDEDDEADIYKMNKGALLNYAKKINLEVSESLTKADIIAKIEDARANS